MEVQWKLNANIPQPILQKFRWRTATEIIDLGTEEMTGHTEEEIWQPLRQKDSRLGLRNQYSLYQEQNQIQWMELPLERITIIPRQIPVSPRGDETDVRAIKGHPAIRKDGPMIQIKWRLCSWQHHAISSAFDVAIPLDVSSPQLITGLISPRYQSPSQYHKRNSDTIFSYSISRE
jgi:hypothetical protein